MQKYNSGRLLPYNSTAVALGQFDGMHIAHKQLLDNAIASNRTVGAFYFDGNPKHVKKLMSNKQKEDAFSECDFIYVQEFENGFSEKTTDEFADFLVGVLHAEDVYVGYNYRFGKNASGDANTLKQLGSDYGFGVHILDEVKIDGEVVCSSTIRSCIEVGDINKANLLLGRTFSIDGNIIRGKQNGKKMGIPTINIDYDKDIVLPKFGVYGGYVMLSNTKHKAIINVGNNPTFGAKKVTIEAHLLDYEGSAYGEYAEVFFEKYVRGEMKFDTPEGLVEQIKRDISIIG